MNGQAVDNIGNYQLLANSIIAKAAKDYIRALRYKKESEADAIERFFKGQEFMLYSTVDPDYLIKNLKKIAFRKGV